MLSLEHLIDGFNAVENTAIVARSTIQVLPVQKALTRRADLAHLITSNLLHATLSNPFDSGPRELTPEEIATIILDAVETISAAERTTHVRHQR